MQPDSSVPLGVHQSYVEQKVKHDMQRGTPVMAGLVDVTGASVVAWDNRKSENIYAVRRGNHAVRAVLQTTDLDTISTVL